MRICERPVTFTSYVKLAENERHVVDMEGIVDRDDDTAGDDSIRENDDTAGDYSMTENDEGGDGDDDLTGADGGCGDANFIGGEEDVQHCGPENNACGEGQLCPKHLEVLLIRTAKQLVRIRGSYWPCLSPFSSLFFIAGDAEE